MVDFEQMPSLETPEISMEENDSLTPEQKQEIQNLTPELLEVYNKFIDEDNTHRLAMRQVRAMQTLNNLPEEQQELAKEMLYNSGGTPDLALEMFERTIRQQPIDGKTMRDIMWKKRMKN